MPRGVAIIGLGPGLPGLLTVEAQRVLQGAHELYVRTRKHPTLDALRTSAVIHSFDYIYEQSNTFEEVYTQIALRVVELAERADGVVYAVPGHPMVGEASVRRILTLARQRDLPIRMVEGLSFVEPTCTLLKLDPLDGLQIADATELGEWHYPPFNPDLPVLVAQLYSRDLAADVKLVLMMTYPDDHEVTVVTAAGTEGVSVRSLALYELDRDQGIDHLTVLYVPPLSEPGSPAALQQVVARLRAPGGCPWDREQTHRSLRPYLLEETYEVLEALDDGDSSRLEEELGDLLLQILLHAQIAVEEGEFQMADVISHIVSKLKRRHPHVFGQVQVASAEEVLINWEQIKSEERHDSLAEGALNGVPCSLPALARAQSLQRRAGRLGFEWPDVDSVWHKVQEEWRELSEASSGDSQERELGDVLFALVSLARWLDIDAECGLREAASRFEQRFRWMECECAERGCRLTELERSELEELWQRGKKHSG